MKVDSYRCIRSLAVSRRLSIFLRMTLAVKFWQYNGCIWLLLFFIALSRLCEVLCLDVGIQPRPTPWHVGGKRRGRWWWDETSKITIKVCEWIDMLKSVPERNFNTILIVPLAQAL
jgi:hypothetical protein